jgi:serine protease
MDNYSLAASLTLTVLLAACGGGGGGGGSSSLTPAPTPSPPPPVVGFSISGAINVSSNLSVDGDTNNPDDPLSPNNTIATAQPISAPATVGGYVNQPGAGETGAVQVTGDIDDFFRVELLAGQTVTMLVADFERADADLYLYGIDEEVVDFSTDIGQLESLLIPADGTYVVNVRSFAGATNYSLAIGTNNAPAGAVSAVSSSSTAAAKIVPWQVVVKYQDSDSGSEVARSQEDLNRRMGMRRRAGGRLRPRLMALEHVALTQQQRFSRLGSAGGRRLQLKDPELRARWETLMTIKALRREPGIVSAEPNYEVWAMATPDDEAYPFQWHYPLINLPAAWDLTTGEPGVIVAVIDTGILSGHPDLAGQLVAGYDFVSNEQFAGDGNGIDSNPEDPGDGGRFGNSSFHGTHVSGTVAAASDNGIGVAGVAWNARVMPVRVLGVDGGGTSYDVEQGIRFAAGLPNDSGTLPAQRADIINLSLGGAPFSQATQSLFNEARAAGVMVVASAGNESSSIPSYPASYSGVISVSAVDAQRRATSYSNFGSLIDIAAPGGDNGVDITGDGYPDGVLSTGGTTTNAGNIKFVYPFFTGTSMASPHVAGVLALMKSVNPDLTPADVDTLLLQGKLTDDLGAAGRDDRYGHGLINAQSAVVAALEATGNSPAENPHLGASSTLLNFGSAAETLNLVLQNNGGGELAILELTSSESWLEVVAADTDANGLGAYLIRVSRENLLAGLYGGEISAVSDVNTVTVNVLVSVVDEATGGDVGRVYVLLINTPIDQIIAQFDAASTAGIYTYQFNNIRPGNYEITAGTDADNDLIICDSGEACGSYLTIDQPIDFELTSDLVDLDFPVEYRVTIPSLNSSSVQQRDGLKDGLPRQIRSLPQAR